MSIRRSEVERGEFNLRAALPFELRLDDFEMAMRDVLRLLLRCQHTPDHERIAAPRRHAKARHHVRRAIDTLTASLAKHARVLTLNRVLNGHPDLVVQGVYPDNAVKAGADGVEIKTTRNTGGAAVDTHGARDHGRMCVFVYDVDVTSEPARDRRPMAFTEVYLAKVTLDDFRRNPRGEVGTRSRTLHREGIKKLREHWVYRYGPPR